MTETLNVAGTSTKPTLVLRPWVGDDASSLVEVYRDPAMRRWVRVPVTNTEDAEAWRGHPGGRRSVRVGVHDSRGGADRVAPQVDNVASCQVAEKSGYALRSTLPATPPFPLEGHLHVRHA